MMPMPRIDAPRVPDDDRAAALPLGVGAPLFDPAGPPVHEVVAAVAAAHPRRVAVESGGRSITYSELDAWSGRIAGRLAGRGLGPGSRVAVLAEPSAAMVAAALGVLRCGAAYVPVDPANPDARIGALMSDARAGGVVATAATAHRVAGLGLPVVDPDEIDPASAPVPLPRPLIHSHDPAYIVYTSGSTGEPKGVLVEHGQLAASTSARRLVYPGSPAFLLVSPLAFDSSVAGLWGTLTSGGRLVVATTEEIREPERLVELVHDHRVDRLLCVPGLYRVLLDAAERVGIERLRTLDTVIVAGEPLPEALVDRHRALRGRGAALVNEYGPTEATVWASYHRVCGPGAGAGPVSIGGPVPGVRLHVLDGRGLPVPHGAEGELVIGGALVARGYFGRPDATARVFVRDPFAGVPGARMYRTGDIVAWNEAGTLDFRGRRDHQVKIRGHRVELGAVEAALRAVPGVRDAAVVPDASGARLAGFLLASPDTDPGAVRARLAETLPAIMVPARLQVVDRFPVTVNGKVDRAALSATGPEVAPVAVAPGGEGATSTGVAAAWAEVLKLDTVPSEVNFFDLGGHSLTMFELQDALERHTGSRPSMVALFRYTTVAAQTSLIRDGGCGPDESRTDMQAAAARRANAVRARRRRAAR